MILTHYLVILDSTANHLATFKGCYTINKSGETLKDVRQSIHDDAHANLCGKNTLRTSTIW